MTAALQDPRLWEVQRRRFPIVMECAMPPGDEPCTQVQCRYHLAHNSVGDHQREPTRDCALSVANDLGGTVEQRYEPKGLVTRIEMPLV